MIDNRVEKYMPPVDAAILRHMKYGQGFTDIYNRAYEAVSMAIDEASKPNATLMEATKAALEFIETSCPYSDLDHNMKVKLRAAIAKAEPQS